MDSVLVRGTLIVEALEARNLANIDSNLLSSTNVSDAWLEVTSGHYQLLATRVVNNTLNPIWNARSIIPIHHDRASFRVKVWDDDYLRQSLIGEVDVPLSPINSSWERDEWIFLNDRRGEVHMRLSFEPFESPSETLLTEPVGTDKLYFKPRSGGSLKLYQDAHVETVPGLETVVLSDHKRNNFSDISEAFENSRKFIYIMGWSLWTDLQMRRDGSSETVGALLKRKADEGGVRVLILLWSELLSSKLCRELFGTHDRQTLDYFNGSEVTAVAVTRKPPPSSFLKESIVETIYTHHMKLIVTDSLTNGLTGFIGGYDLTDGRWDTPAHPIWETLASIHKEDFYNGFVSTVTSETGPREPWHDVHARIDGIGAYDLLRIFEERWKKQAVYYSDLLIPIAMEDIEQQPPEANAPIWNIQVLRSCDSGSAVFSDGEGGLVDFQYSQEDRSVHHAYVSLIRSCTKFLYIESQYFIGSAFAWETERDTCAPNLVPIEISEQIIHGIKTGSPVRVYVVLPLCPEGDPDSTIGASYMSEILHWQFLTIQMMYRRIGEALADIGSSEHPEDFLLFLSLGKKEKRSRTSEVFPRRAKASSAAYEWQKRSRFVIYVHSKMALTDDARVLIGSANINQRSLDGGRDTECAVAASQVKYDGVKQPSGEVVRDGEVAQFRRCLWFEHTGGLSEKEALLSDPSSKDCISFLRGKAEENLLNYADDKLDDDIAFRFIKYPLEIEKDGKVSVYPSLETIPDFGLPVMGKIGFIPRNVTT